MADSKRIGHIGKNGNPVYPQESISGRPFEHPPTQIKMIGGGQFCVLDIFPPPGFDLDLALAKVTGEPVITQATDDATGKQVDVAVMSDTPKATPAPVNKKA